MYNILEHIGMSLTNYKIEAVMPDVSGFGKHAKEIESLLPSREEHCVSFDLIGVDTSIANGFRRTAIEELELKALTFDNNTITTNVDYILFGEFLDRIQQIPIRQDIPDDLIMSINAINTSNENGIMTLYSDSIIGGEKYIPGRFRIAELRPGNFLKVPRITVVRGTGRDNACFSLTADFTYDNLDFMDVWFINSKGNRIKKRVRVSDVVKLAGKKTDVWNKRILVIPNPNYEKVISDEVREKIEIVKYDLVLKSDKAYSTDDEYLAEQSSLMVRSNDFRMSYYLFGQIDPKDFVRLVCTRIVERLGAVKRGLEQIYRIEGAGPKTPTKKSPKTPTKKSPKTPKKTADEIAPIDLALDSTGVVEVRLVPIMVRHEGEQTAMDLWRMTVKGETHTVSELIVNHAYLIDPEIPFITAKMIHPRDNQITIEILHPTPQKICLDAIDQTIEVFTGLIASVSK
jgi:hypothetical protein